MRKFCLCIVLSLVFAPMTLLAAEQVTPTPDSEPAIEGTLSAPAAPVNEEAVDLQSFVKMAIHNLDSAIAASSENSAEASAGASCTICTNHQQCTAVCGGFGACLRDLGMLCDVGWFTKVCACG